MIYAIGYKQDGESLIEFGKCKKESLVGTMGKMVDKHFGYVVLFGIMDANSWERIGDITAKENIYLRFTYLDSRVFRSHPFILEWIFNHMETSPSFQVTGSIGHFPWAKPEQFVWKGKDPGKPTFVDVQGDGFVMLNYDNMNRKRHFVVNEGRKPVGKRLRLQVLERDSFKCRACGRNPREHDVVLHIDHIHPRSKGGLSISDNLQTLCEDCNRAKSDRDFPYMKKW